METGQYTQNVALNIRDALPSDTEAIRAVHARSIDALGTEAYSQTQVEAWVAGCESADYTTPIEGDDLEFVVAERTERVVGFGSLKLVAPAEYDAAVDAEITAVYVHPSVSRQGVGTRIYTDLERRARSHGIQTLGLSASLNAVPFYESHGYDRVREFEHEFSGHDSTGVTGTVVEMKKSL